MEQRLVDLVQGLHDRLEGVAAADPGVVAWMESACELIHELAKIVRTQGLKIHALENGYVSQPTDYGRSVPNDPEQTRIKG